MAGLRRAWAAHPGVGPAAVGALLLMVVLWPRVDWLLWSPRTLTLKVRALHGVRAQLRWDRAQDPHFGWGTAFYLGQGEHQVAIIPSTGGQDIWLLGAATDEGEWVNLRDLPLPAGWRYDFTESAYGKVGIRRDSASGAAAPLKLTVSASRLALAFASGPQSGIAKVVIDGRSQELDLTNAWGTSFNDVRLLIVPPGPEPTLCRVQLPYGYKRAIRLAPLPGDSKLELLLYGIGWRAGRESGGDLSLPRSADALGSASVARRGDALLLTFPNADGWVEFPDLVPGATPSPLLRVGGAVLLICILYAAVWGMWSLLRRPRQEKRWVPLPVPAWEKGLVLTGALGLHLLVSLSSEPKLTTDSAALYLPAARLVFYRWTLEPLTFSQFIGPGYPMVIEFVNRLVGDAAGLIVFQHLLMGLACYCAWHLVRERAGPFWGWLTAGAAILDPPLLTFPTLVLTQGVYPALYLIVLFLATRQFRWGWVHAVALGALLGFAALVRTQGLMLVPFVFALAWLLSWQRRRPYLHAGLAAAALGLVLAPVSIFNHGRGFLLPSTGLSGNIVGMAHIHDLVDWSIPEVEAKLPGTDYARTLFHPLRCPPAGRHFTGVTFTGLEENYVQPIGIGGEGVPRDVARLSFARHPWRYARAVAESFATLTEFEREYYGKESSWWTESVIRSLAWRQFDSSAQVESRRERTFTELVVRGAAHRIFPPGLLFWLAMAAALGIVWSVATQQSDPVPLLFGGFGLAYILTLALIPNSISRYTVCTYLPLLVAATLTLAYIVRAAAVRVLSVRAPASGVR